MKFDSIVESILREQEDPYADSRMDLGFINKGWDKLFGTQTAPADSSAPTPTPTPTPTPSPTPSTQRYIASPGETKPGILSQIGTLAGQAAFNSPVLGPLKTAVNAYNDYAFNQQQRQIALANAQRAEQEMRAKGQLSPNSQPSQQQAQQSQTNNSQQVQTVMDNAGKRYEQWKQEFSKKYPGTDFTITDQNIKKALDEFKSNPGDPSIQKYFASGLDANIDRIIKHNENLFKSPGYYNTSPQQSSDPFQARVDQMNQSNQQWQANPGIQQVGSSTPQTQQPQQSASVSQLNQKFNSPQQTYTGNYMPPSKPQQMPFTATKTY